MLDVDRLFRKNFIERLKAMIYGQHYNDEDLDMYCRMHITFKKIEFILGYNYINQKQHNLEIPPRIFEIIDINKSSKGSVELKFDEKAIQTFQTTHHEINFNSRLNEVLGFTGKKYPARTH